MRILDAADADLVRLTLARHEPAAAEICRRYRRIVRLRLQASTAEADLDDAVQDVFVRCFEHLDRLREPAALRSYLIGIAVRSGAMAQRRKRAARCLLTRTGDLPETWTFPDVECAQMRSRARAVLIRLKPQSVRILSLRFIEEKELTELAFAMGVSLATAKRRLARAAAQLRRLVSGEPRVVEYLSPGAWAAAKRHSAPPSPVRHATC